LAEQRVPSAAGVCWNNEGLFLNRVIPKDNLAALSLAERIKNTDLGRYAYMAYWKDANTDSPWTRKGNTLVVGTTAETTDKWMDTIGDHSIGLMLNGLPEDGPGTAILRVGNTIYYYGAIQGRGTRTDRKVLDARPYLQALHRSGRVEATFILKPRELQAVREFVEARGRGEVIAQTPLRGYRVGEPLKPRFKHTGTSLHFESCAGACTSPFDYRWHDHSELGDILRSITDQNGLDPTHVAKRLIWSNFRNPYTSAITLHRIDLSKKNLVDNFQANLSWGPLRGLASWSGIPDPKPARAGHNPETRVPLTALDKKNSQ
jgi:hypothetical protein